MSDLVALSHLLESSMLGTASCLDPNQFVAQSHKVL
jgi:hypothetical protein